MANLALRLKLHLQANALAVTDVSIGDANDRSTWRVEPASLQSAASPMIAAFDPADGSRELDAQANDIDGNLLIQAVAQLDFEERQKLQVKAGQTLLTGAQCKARVKAIYRSLLG